MQSSSVVSRWIDKARDELRLRGPLSSDPTAQVLHSLLLALACWRILCFPLIVPFAFRPEGAGGLFGSLLLIDVVALHQLRRGSFASASLVYLCGHWLAYTALIVLTTGIAGRSTVFYLVLPISAAWLMGARPALLSAAVCLLSILIFAVAQELGVQFSGYFSSAAPVARWSETIVAMIITIVPVARILQILQDALTRSREAEQVLQQHRIGLEKLVHQRTAELEQARDEAQAASRAKTVFLATLSHQLRSPLNAILLLSDLASADLNITEEHCRDWQVIRRTSQHLLHLIDQVLDAARIESGQVNVENGRFDILDLLRGVSNLMRVRAEQKNLALLVEDPPNWPRLVYADEDKLRHVLINLVDNAIKYTERGQIILREYAAVVDTPTRVRLRFEIADTGIGISQHDQARIFEPFARIDTKAEGSGLGLAITRHYVELMGGNIYVDSALGQGSRFGLEVPVDVMEERSGDFTDASYISCGPSAQSAATWLGAGGRVDYTP